MKLASRTQRQKRAPGSTRSCSISRACRNLSPLIRRAIRP
jgi:hypothetical protein